MVTLPSLENIRKSERVVIGRLRDSDPAPNAPSVYGVSSSAAAADAGNILGILVLFATSERIQDKILACGMLFLPSRLLENLEEYRRPDFIHLRLPQGRPLWSLGRRRVSQKAQRLGYNWSLKEGREEFLFGSMTGLLSMISLLMPPTAQSLETYSSLSAPN
ncbi:hypothetical protein B0H19DRAFT_1065890 [Mycena capillaripes]|nr:hypothetical protein B0H19DRAFT_1065890 [Mycena capillaripes]